MTSRWGGGGLRCADIDQIQFILPADAQCFEIAEERYHNLMDITMNGWIIL